MRDIFKQFDIELSDQQENKLKEYYKILVEENKKMNLTSITEYEDVVWKHFLDSALIMKDSLWNGKNKVFDVGTGAGFPGIVLAILNPESKFVLLDSLNKRVDFLKQVCDKLKINNVTAIHGRAETYGQNEMYRNQFDFVVSRAVAELPILMEYCVPFAKVNGYFDFLQRKEAGRRSETLQKMLFMNYRLSLTFGQVFFKRKRGKILIIYQKSRGD